MRSRHSGYNVTYCWWWQFGHRAVTLETQAASSTPENFYMVPGDPSRVSPIVCNSWGDAVSNLYGVSHYLGGNPSDFVDGVNECFLDGHVEWIQGARLVRGNNGGAYYYWWQSRYE